MLPNFQHEERKAFAQGFLMHRPGKWRPRAEDVIGDLFEILPEHARDTVATAIRGTDGDEVIEDV